MKPAVIIWILLSTSMIVNAQKKPKIKGNKEVAEIVRQIEGSFNVIELDDALDVRLIQGKQNQYILRTDNNLLDIIEFTVFDNTLREYTNFKITKTKKLEIELTVRDVEQLILKNGANVTSKNKLVTDQLYLTAYNSSSFDLDIKSEDATVILHRNSGGKLKVDSDNTTIVMNDRTDLKTSLTTDKLRVTLNSSAELNVAGEADNAYLNLKGSSKLNAKKLKISAADLYTSNSSNVYVHVKKNLELYAQGTSKIYVFGDPKIEIKGLTDKSKIIKK